MVSKDLVAAVRPKIALLLVHNFQPFHNQVDAILKAASLKRDLQIKTIGCIGILPYCPAIDVARPDRQIAGRFSRLKHAYRVTLLRPLICYRCRKNVDSSFGNVVRPRNYIPLWSQARLYAYSLFLFFCPQGLKKQLSKSFKDNTISCYLTSQRMEAADVKPNWALARFLATYKYFKDCALLELDPDKIAITLMFNGRMLPYRPYLNECSRRDIPVLVHDRGFAQGSCVIKHGEPAHSRLGLYQNLKVNWEDIKSSIEYEGCREWVERFYEGRATGKNIDCQVPEYSGMGSSIYNVPGDLIVFYMTTPDEVDPSSVEFELVKYQWDILPRLCSLLTEGLSSSEVNIVIRPHPNFFNRNHSGLYAVMDKLDDLANRLINQTNVVVDMEPAKTSPMLAIKNSTLSVTFASSSALESEFFGTPALVPRSHIYSYGCSYSAEFESLLHRESSRELVEEISRIKLGVRKGAETFIKFSYLWFHLDKFYFSSYLEEPLRPTFSCEHSSDFRYIVDHMFEQSSLFLMNRFTASYSGDS